jgi:predicted MFS family arabinose efflux permease
MYFVSAVGLAAGMGLAVLLRHVPLPPKIGLKARLAPLRDSRIGWTLTTTYLGMAGNFLVYVYFSVVFDRVLANAVVFGALLVVWGVSGTATNIALSRVLDQTSPTKVMLVVLVVQAVDMTFLPWTSASLWSAVLAIAVWGATGWGIQGPQQYRLVTVAPAIAPVLLGLNTAATYLGVTTAGILGAVGIHLLGAHYLSFLSVGVFMLAIFTSHMAGLRIEDHRTADSPAAMQPVRS